MQVWTHGECADAIVRILWAATAHHLVIKQPCRQSTHTARARRGADDVTYTRSDRVCTLLDERRSTWNPSADRSPCRACARVGGVERAHATRPDTGITHSKRDIRMRDFLWVRDVSYENDVAGPEADDTIDRNSRQERNKRRERLTRILVCALCKCLCHESIKRSKRTQFRSCASRCSGLAS
jgi:hypothetical protein